MVARRSSPGKLWSILVSDNISYPTDTNPLQLLDCVGATQARAQGFLGWAAGPASRGAAGRAEASNPGQKYQWNTQFNV